MENTILFGNGMNLPPKERNWDGILNGMTSDDIFMKIRSQTLRYEYIMLQKREYQTVPFIFGGKMLMAGGKFLGRKVSMENDIYKRHICKTLLDCPPSLLYKELAKLNINNYLTTNYELFLNEAFCEMGYSVDYIKDEYRLYTYCYAEKESKDVCIFNIHGDVKDPQSLVLGFSQYSKSVVEIEKLLYNDKNILTQKKNWVDIMLNSNLYIIGFGLAEDEIDIWDVLVFRKRLNRSQGHKVNSVMYFDVSKERNIEKEKIYNGFDIDVIFIKVNDEDWAGAYKSALDRIGREVGLRDEADILA